MESEEDVWGYCVQAVTVFFFNIVVAQCSYLRLKQKKKANE